MSKKNFLLPTPNVSSSNMELSNIPLPEPEMSAEELKLRKLALASLKIDKSEHNEKEVLFSHNITDLTNYEDVPMSLCSSSIGEDLSEGETSFLSEPQFSDETELRERALKSLLVKNMFEDELKACKSVYQPSIVIHGPNKERHGKFVIEVDESSDDENEEKLVQGLVNKSSLQIDAFQNIFPRDDAADELKKLKYDIKTIDRSVVNQKNKVKHLTLMTKKYQASVSKYLKSSIEKRELIKSLRLQLEKAIKEHKNAVNMLSNQSKLFKKTKKELSVAELTYAANFKKLKRTSQIYLKKVKAIRDIDLLQLRTDLNASLSSLTSCEKIHTIPMHICGNFDMLDRIVPVANEAKLKINEQTNNGIDPMVPLCPYLINGECIDQRCVYQHPKDLTSVPDEMRKEISLLEMKNNYAVVDVCPVCDSYFKDLSTPNILSKWHTSLERYLCDKNRSNTLSFVSETSKVSKTSFIAAKECLNLYKHVIYAYSLSSCDGNYSFLENKIMHILHKSSYNKDLCLYIMWIPYLKPTFKKKLFIVIRDKLYGIVTSKLCVTIMQQRMTSLIYLIIGFLYISSDKKDIEDWLSEVIFDSDTSDMSRKHWKMVYFVYAYIINKLQLHKFVVYSEVPFLTEIEVLSIQEILLKLDVDCISDCLTAGSKKKKVRESHIATGFLFMYSQHLLISKQSSISCDISSKINKSVCANQQFFKHLILFTSKKPTKLNFVPSVFYAIFKWYTSTSPLDYKFIIKELICSHIAKGFCQSKILSQVLGIDDDSYFIAGLQKPPSSEMVYTWIVYYLYNICNGYKVPERLIEDFHKYGMHTLKDGDEFGCRLFINLNIHLLNNLNLPRLYLEFLRNVVLEKAPGNLESKSDSIWLIEIIYSIDFQILLLSPEFDQFIIDVVEMYGWNTIPHLYLSLKTLDRWDLLLNVCTISRWCKPKSEVFWLIYMNASFYVHLPKLDFNHHLDANSRKNFYRIIINILQEAVLAAPDSYFLWKYLATISTRLDNLKEGIRKIAEDCEMLDVVNTVWNSNANLPKT